MTKTRLEAFSDGMFAIIITILILELKVPHIDNNSIESFFNALVKLLPKFLSFAFSFFLIAVFWINHHHILHQVKEVNTEFLWLNIVFLFFTCLFPFITAFIGDYYQNPFIVSLYPLNMLFSGLVLRKLWKYAFVKSNIAPNTLSGKQIKQELGRYNISTLINIALIGVSFVWLPATLIAIMVMPVFFVMPDMVKK